MPFGTRRFTQLVYHPEGYRARFVPLNLGLADEYVTEDALKREIDDNARAARPLPDAEERLALAAFSAQARGKTFTRAAVESVAARGQQRVIVDVLDAGERATIERWRKLVTLRSAQQVSRTPADNADTSVAAVHDFLDASKDALAVLDKYLPKGT